MVLSKLLNNNPFNLLIILLCSALAISPTLLVGIPHSSLDFIHHLQISYAFFDSIGEGVLFPNWVFQENNGYGAVTVRFYPPLIGYTIAVFRYLTNDWQLALFFAFTLWSFIGGFGVYVWTSDFLANRWQCLIAAILLMIAPYHLCQFFTSFMFGEFAALSAMPFGFYFSGKLCERSRLSDILGFAVSISLIILSNLPQTVIATLCIGLYVLLNLDKNRFIRQFIGLAAGSLLALALSAFYWVRMVFEMNFINVSQPNTDPDYDYRNHFLLSDFTVDEKHIWFVTLMVLISLSFVFLALCFSKKIKTFWQDIQIRNIGVVTAFAFLMMTLVSKPVWDNVSFLQKIQFPWRFSTIIALGSSIAVAYCLDFITRDNLRKNRPLILLLAGLIFIFSTFSIKQIALGGVFISPEGFKEVTDKIPHREGLDHWLPVWVDKKAFKEKTKVYAGQREVGITVWENEKRAFTVAAGSPARARIALIYYPHWKALVNGQPAEVLPAQSGEINLELPNESSTVELNFEEPLYSRISRKFSVAAFFAVTLLLLFQALYQRKSLAVLIMNKITDGNRS